MASLERPVQVYTLRKFDTDKSDHSSQVSNKVIMNEKDIQKAAIMSTMSRQIIVKGVGEIDLKPDSFAVTIMCKAVKENIQEAKNSVTRRLDYIVQTLKNGSLKDDDIKVYQHASHQDLQAHYDGEVEAHFSDVANCLSLSNLLAEKLGPGIHISLPVCYHAQGSLDKLRKQAGMLAIYNARQKALDMARVIHLSVGHALQVQEEGSVETQGSSSTDLEEFDLNTSIQQKIAEKTVKICSTVKVCFELKLGKEKKSIN